MAPRSQEEAGAEFDRQLGLAGWSVQAYRAADTHTARGVALREFQLNPVHGFAGCLLYGSGKAMRAEALRA